MDLLRWILLGLGLLLIGAVWLHGRRNRPAHQESLFETARRRWSRERSDGAGAKAGADPAGIDLPDREEPDLGFDPAELDELFGGQRESTEAPLGREGGGERGASASASGPGRDAGEAAAGAAETQAPASGDPGSGEQDAGEPDVGEPDARAVEAAARSRGEPAAREQDSATAAPADEPREAVEERIVVLYVVAPRGERLRGADLASAFSRLDLAHGELDIFHRRDESGRTVFSVANATEPGTFDPASMTTMETPGIALFARLPGPLSATEMFDELAAAAHALAGELGGRALDGRQSTLTRQTEQAMRDELLEYEHRRARPSR